MIKGYALAQEQLSSGQTIAASSILQPIGGLSDPNVTEFAFWDTGTGGGHFTLNGVVQANNQWIIVTPAQLANLQYAAGASAATETIYVAALDTQWTYGSTTATVALPPPTVTAANQTLSEGNSIAASNFVAGTTDPAGKAITQYSFMDSGVDGHLVYNGATLNAGQWYNFTSAQLAHLSFVAGNTTGTDSVSIKVSDGGAFSAAATSAIIVQAPQGVASLLTDAGIRADVTHLMTNNALSYASMLTVLEDATATAMTAGKFPTLHSLASLLNVSGGISVSAAVQQLADDVILGNAANADWNGGSAATSLGNLSATSSALHGQELVGKWFLGTDLPTPTAGSYSGGYHLSTLPLYGSSGAPVYTDASQGVVGDCYLIASLGETALRNASAIQSMITDNGNGTDTIRFYLNGASDYVTVNNQLPVMTGGYAWANGSNLEYANGPVAWAALIEKAFVEFTEQINPTLGAAYANISGGTASALTEITNQPVTSYYLSPTATQASLTSTLATLAVGWKAGDLMLMSTPNNTGGNLVGNHMFEVTGVDAATGLITFHNPWNTAVNDSASVHLTFAETMQQLAAAGCCLYDSALLPHSSASPAHLAAAIHLAAFSDFVLH